MKRTVVLATVLLAIGARTAVAAPGDPPRGLSPLAASMYRGQFALCSLSTLPGLAAELHVEVSGLPAATAATRLARAKDRGIGSAATSGCRNGLLYRYRTDQTISSLRQSLRSRISAEKYVAAVYMVIVAAFFVYVLIHAGKITRLARTTEVLMDPLETEPAAFRRQSS